MKNIGFRTLFIAIILLLSPDSKSFTGSKVSIVVIDAGHGGKDPGTSGKKSLEKNIVLSIARKVGGYIKKQAPDIKVIYTRKDDRFIPLDERAEIANKNKADMFVSIHANSSQSPKVYGTETYVMGTHKTSENLEVAQRENSVILLDEKYKERYESFDPKSPESYILFSLTQSAFQENSMRLAHIIESEFKEKAKRKSRGVKQSGFLVLWQTSMPSILVEVGYLTNREEEQFLSSKYGQELIASGIYRAIKAYKKQVDSINY